MASDVLDTVRSKVEAGDRITNDEALFLMRQVNILDLAPLAQTVRYRHNPDPDVTFVVDTNLNYTNVCDAYCTFCAFYRTERDDDAYTHSVDEVMEMLGQARDKGVTTVLMQGGLNPKLPFQYYLDLVSESRRQYPEIHPHFFSAPEIMKMSEVSGLSVMDVLTELRKVGLETIPGGGSEVLSNRVKAKISRLFPKGKVDDWTLVHSEAHKLGYKTTPTMMYGHLEEDEDVIEHLDHIRRVQDENGGFTAFIPWSYKKDNTALGKRVKSEAGPNAYLRMIALSRIYLDNFPHIQASWFSEGKKTGQVALHFGGDDFGGTLFDENVMQEAGFYNRTTVDEVCHIIRDAGFTPVQRNTLYGIVQRW